MYKMKTTLVISTYNWPEALELVLLSIEKQTVLPNEVLIADDGSTNDTKKIIEDFKKRINLKVNHVWHEDKGFRKSIILNKALAKADGEYIIQSDGDCILDSHFIEDHINFSEPNVYLYGSRVSILEDFVKVLFKNKNISFNYFSKGIKVIILDEADSMTFDAQFALRRIIEKYSNISKRVYFR